MFLLLLAAIVNLVRADSLFTPQEVATLLRVSVDTVHDMIRDGRLQPIVRAGPRSVRIPATAINSLGVGHDSER